MHRLCRTLCTLIALFLLTVPGHAREEILDFDARIKVFATGELQVVETIRVRGENAQIRRGIYRDFPLMVEDANGREREVGFDVVSVTRDGMTEDFSPYFPSGVDFRCSEMWFLL